MHTYVSPEIAALLVQMLHELLAQPDCNLGAGLEDRLLHLQQLPPES